MPLRVSIGEGQAARSIMVRSRETGHTWDRSDMPDSLRTCNQQSVSENRASHNHRTPPWDEARAAAARRVSEKLENCSPILPGGR
jgi:hypothetical protein